MIRGNLAWQQNHPTAPEGRTAERRIRLVPHPGPERRKNPRNATKAKLVSPKQSMVVLMNDALSKGELPSIKGYIYAFLLALPMMALVAGSIYGGISYRLQAIEASVIRVEKRVIDVEEKVTNLQRRQNRTDSDVLVLKTIMGITGASKKDRKYD